MVLGIYYLTDFFNTKYPDYNTEEEWKEKILPVARFASIEDAIHAFNNKQVTLKDKIVVVHN
jgi:hypothetical protein|nr:hypothetical protein [bacterium]